MFRPPGGGEPRDFGSALRREGERNGVYFCALGSLMEDLAD